MTEIVTIESIGHRGDGIYRGAGGIGYAPFTLPGERVRIGPDAATGGVELLEPSARRVAPLCRHFGQCGGCALQMMALPDTRRLKRDFVVAALAREGLEPPVGETIGVDPASRRRAVLTAIRAGGTIRLGYSERGSNRLVDIAECPILAAPLAARLPALRALLAPLAPNGEPVRITALVTTGGLDLNLEGVGPPAAGALPALAETARATGVARLSLGGEPLLALAEPAVEVSGVQITPPPGAFLQASTEAEAAIAGLVTEHLAGARRVVDLFAGLGTFTFALARRAGVRAVESNQAALDALQAAARAARGLKRVETERRDLFAFPLAPAELAAFDAALFDPPRSGGKSQSLALAQSRLKRIAAISCNPASFARDARILVDGGFRLERVVPVDQFVYSAETEVVGLFSRSP